METADFVESQLEFYMTNFKKAGVWMTEKTKSLTYRLPTQ